MCVARHVHVRARPCAARNTCVHATARGAARHRARRARLLLRPPPLSQPSPCSLFLSIFSLVSTEHHRRFHHRCLHSPFFLPPLHALPFPLHLAAVACLFFSVLRLRRNHDTASLSSLLPFLRFRHRPSTIVTLFRCSSIFLLPFPSSTVPPSPSTSSVSITHLLCVSLPPLSQPSITVTLRRSSLLFLRLSPLRQPPRRRPSPPFPCSFSASSFQSPNANDRPRLSSAPPSRPPLLPSATAAASSLCPSIFDHRPNHRLSALLVGSFLADDRGQPPRALSSSIGSIVPPCQSLFSLRPPSASRPPSLFSSLPLSLRAAAGHRHRRHFPLPAPW